MPTTELTPRYEAVLCQVGLYRLMFAEPLRRIIRAVVGTSPHRDRSDDCSEAGTALKRLADAGYLNHHRKGDPDLPPFPGNVPYFTLTPAGARQCDVPGNRAVVPGKQAFQPAALETHVATLWFATMGTAVGMRLNPGQLVGPLGGDKVFENVPHCLAPYRRKLRLFRVYVASTNRKGIVKHVQRWLAEVQQHPALRDWVASHSYGLAILAPDDRYCGEIVADLRAADLLDKACLFVTCAPTTTTLHRALKSLD